MKITCDIIIPVWNQLAFTRECIDSIMRNTDIDYRLIVVDNASDPECAQYLESLSVLQRPPVTVLRNGKNLGFVKAVNQGIALSKAPYVCLLNNDTLVTDGWLTEMINVAGSNKEIGVVNPSSNNLGQRPDVGEPIEAYAGRLEGMPESYVELGAAVGFCMLIKREVVERCGVFDEIYGMGNFEDTDFSRRAAKEGYLLVRACKAYVWHREGGSFGKVKSFEEDFNRNREIFEFRWGRPRRVAYILDSYDDNTLKRLEIDSIRMARSGDWVWYFSKEELKLPHHSNIIYKRIPSERFYLNAVFQILKKKKRFSEIFVGEERLGRFLERLSFIHKAKVSYY